MKRLFLFALFLGLPACGRGQTNTNCSGISLGDLGSLNGWVPSPNDAWHQNISGAPLDANSTKIMTTPGDLANRFLHPDFSNVVDGAYGIPYTVVDTKIDPIVPVSFQINPDSDISLYPLNANTPLEGNPGQCWNDGNDHHAIVIDRNKCVAYEVYQANLCHGTWTGYAGTIWDLTTTEQRPYGMTSTDAAGLSVFEGLIRYDEIVAGAINHAIRFTAQFTKNDANGGYFTAPATHAAGSLWGTDNIMGMRIRLKADVDISQFSPTNQIILNAMKQYGMILADNGSDLFFQGTPDPRWDDNDLSNLKKIPSTDFEVVQMNPVYDSSSAPAGTAPVVNSWAASADNVTPGTSVTLTPDVTGGSYEYVQEVGFARGPITVTPTTTSTYTLATRNSFGVTYATTTVHVATSSTPTLAFAPIAAQTWGTGPVGVSATSNSSGAIAYSVVSGPATITGNLVTLTGLGTVTLQASQSAAGAFVSATATASFQVVAPAPSLVFVPIANVSYGAPPFSVSATSNSSGTIGYAVVSGPASISGNTVTVTGAGNVTLIATQAAAGSFGPGTATVSFSVSGIAPTLSFAAIATQTYGTAPFAVWANSNSAGAITYSVVSGPASATGNMVTVTGVGAVTLQASQAAAGGYASGTAMSSFNVNGLAPTLAFAPIGNVGYGAVPFAVSATSNSTGAITYAVMSGPAVVAGDVVTLTGIGTVTLQATQVAAGDYLAGSTTANFVAGPSSVVLTGDFSVPSSGPTIDLAQGQSGNTTLTVAPVNGFAGTVTFTCAMPTAMVASTCTATNAILSNSSKGFSSVTVTTAAAATQVARSHAGEGGGAKGLAVLCVMAPLSLCLWRRGGARLGGLLMAVLGVVLATGMTGCSGGLVISPVTPAGTYTLTVNGTSGSLRHTTYVTVVVQ